MPSRKDYWEVIQFKESKNGKNFRIRLGSALPRTQDGGFTVYLNTLPLPDHLGRVQFIVTPQSDYQQAKQDAERDMRDERRSSGDDDVPF